MATESLLTQYIELGLICLSFLLLSINPTAYDIILWWAVLTFPLDVVKSPWPVALGVVVSSLNSTVPSTTVFGASIASAVIVKKI